MGIQWTSLCHEIKQQRWNEQISRQPQIAETDPGKIKNLNKSI